MKIKSVIVVLYSLLLALLLLPACGKADGQPALQSESDAASYSATENTDAASESEEAGLDISSQSEGQDSDAFSKSDGLDSTSESEEVGGDVSSGSEDPAVSEEAGEAEEIKPENKEKEEYTLSDLDGLVNTDIFLNSAIEHIFNGSINKKGNATGYHYEGIIDSDGSIVEGTRSEGDENGVYEGRVTVSGIEKSGNGGYSTFYPMDMSPQEVVDAINQAYSNKKALKGNLYAGITDEGIEIDMALTDDGKIITAYPIMEN